MKFFCSILILAGVFALNDALTFDEQMLLANDQSMVEELQRDLDNRDASSTLECSQNLLQTLTDILNSYNDQMSVCNKTREDAIDFLTKGANKLIKSYNKIIQDTCDSVDKCEALESASDILDCIDRTTADDADKLSIVSNDASVSSSALGKDIQNILNDEDICQKEAFGIYSEKSNDANSEFSNCVQGKETGGGQKPVTTEATTESESEKPEEEVEEVQPQNRANRYRGL